MSVCVNVVAETVNVKLNNTESKKSAGFSCWDTPNNHFNNVASGIGVKGHNFIIQQRTLNSKMTRAELESAFCNWGDI